MIRLLGDLALKSVALGAMLRVAAFLAGLFPWRALRAIGAFLGFVAGSLLRIRRRHVEHAMRRAAIVEPPRTARAMYESLGTGLCELLWIARRVQRPLAPLVRFSPEAIACLQACRKRECGLVIATAHTGNWDLVACAAAELVPQRLLVVTKRLSIAAIDQFWQGARQRRGVTLVEPSGAFAAAQRMLRAGGLAAVLVDQAPHRSRGVTPISFLGAEALADLTAPILACRTGVPLALVAGRRLRDGTHLVELLGMWEPPARTTRAQAARAPTAPARAARAPTAGAGAEEAGTEAASRMAWAARTMTLLSGRLEAFVTAHPDQWLWLHRRWEQRVVADRTRMAAAAGKLEPPRAPADRRLVLRSGER